MKMNCRNCQYETRVDYKEPCNSCLGTGHNKWKKRKPMKNNLYKKLGRKGNMSCLTCQYAYENHVCFDSGCCTDIVNYTKYKPIKKPKKVTEKKDEGKIVYYCNKYYPSRWETTDCFMPSKKTCKYYCKRCNEKFKLIPVIEG